MTSLLIEENNNKSNPFFDALNTVLNKQTVTENGALAVSTGMFGGVQSAQAKKGDRLEAALTDLFGESIRDKSISDWNREIRLILDLVPQEKIGRSYAMSLIYRFLANLRDCRNGKGERMLSYHLFSQLYKFDKDLAKIFLHPFVRDFGFYGDLVTIYTDFKTKEYSFLRDACVEIFVEEIHRVISNNESSLIGKWAPSERGTVKNLKTSVSQERARMGRTIANKYLLKITPEQHKNKHLDADGNIKKDTKIYARTLYRKTLSTLRRRANVVERKMSSNSFSEINYSNVPAGAISKYGKLSFQNKTKSGEYRSDDPDRINGAVKFQEECNKSIETGKGIKGKNSGAHKICKYYISNKISSVDSSIEAQWSNLVKETIDQITEGDGLPSCLSMCDVSGSMSGTPMEVCVSLGILLSLVAPDPWKRKILTFSMNPELHHISGNNLFDMVRNLKSASWGMNTDFAKAFDLILKTAKNAKLTSEQMPSMVFVFSDMQFDTAVNPNSYYRDGASSKTSNGELYHGHASIVRAYEEAGYQVPHIVFWNLRSTNAKPYETISEGVSVMSGYSDAMLKDFMSGKFADMVKETPWDRVNRILNEDRYESVNKMVMDYYGIVEENSE